MVGIQIKFVCAIILPEEDLQFIGSAALFDQPAFGFHDVQEDTDLLPVRLDQLCDLGELDEGRDGVDLDDQRAGLLSGIGA